MSAVDLDGNFLTMLCTVVFLVGSALGGVLNFLVFARVLVRAFPFLNRIDHEWGLLLLFLFMIGCPTVLGYSIFAIKFTYFKSQSLATVAIAFLAVLFLIPIVVLLLELAFNKKKTDDIPKQ